MHVEMEQLEYRYEILEEEMKARVNTEHMSIQ